MYGWISIDYSVITIIKRNICTGKKLTWHKKNHYPSEMSFVADPEVSFIEKNDTTIVNVSRERKRTARIERQRAVQQELGAEGEDGSSPEGPGNPAEEEGGTGDKRE